MTTGNSREIVRWSVLIGIVLALSVAVVAQKEKSAPAKTDATGHYEGNAKNHAGDVITVNIDLTEKDNAMSGMIRSSHGDFAITGGSHRPGEITLEFDAGGPVGTITLHPNDDSWVGTWSAGDDGGPVEVKKVAPGSESKGKL
jgi:hypothetical protein